MRDASDGLVEAVFGVLLFDGYYEAWPGVAGFQGGKLVGLRIGRAAPLEDDDGLTTGFTLLSDVAEAPAKSGYALGRAVSRVYVHGALDSEADFGQVYVSTDAR